MTSGSPLADPPGYRPKNVSTRSAALSNLNSAAQPSKLPFSGSGDHLPSLTVMRHLPPHGPATSMPYWKSCPAASFWSTSYCHTIHPLRHIPPAVPPPLLTTHFP